MCYSAQVVQSYERYEREFGADIDFYTFAKLYGQRFDNAKIKTTRAMDAAMEASHLIDLQDVRAMVQEYKALQIVKLKEEISSQGMRLARAELALKKKITKKATKDQRIATSKIAKDEAKLAYLQSNTITARDSRMFPGVYVPVLVMEEGRKVVRPMRYLCRIAGSDESIDKELPGTYNARLDNLEGFWRNQFGYTHGIAIITNFFEHVVNENGENVILEFWPRNGQDLYVACLWSYWSEPGKDDLYSFAFIMDEAPPEVLAAGHTRCVIPIRREDVDAWLNPDPMNLNAMYDIFDRRDRPYYEHRLDRDTSV